MHNSTDPHTLVWHEGQGQQFLRMPTKHTDFSLYEGMEGAVIVPEHLAKLAPRMLEALKKVEWAVFNDADYGLTKFCQECRRGPDLGHSEECSIGALLNEARGGDSDE